MTFRMHIFYACRNEIWKLYLIVGIRYVVSSIVRRFGQRYSQYDWCWYHWQLFCAWFGMNSRTNRDDRALWLHNFCFGDIKSENCKLIDDMRYVISSLVLQFCRLYLQYDCCWYHMQPWCAWFGMHSRISRRVKSFWLHIFCACKY